MAEESDATTRQQVLDLIVEKGPVTASSIAKVLGLTTAAVRRHITLLLDSKEIAEHEPGAPSKRGRGRPARHYVATDMPPLCVTSAVAHSPCSCARATVRFNMSREISRSCATLRRLPLASCSMSTSNDCPRSQAGDTCARPTSPWACP